LEKTKKSEDKKNTNNLSFFPFREAKEEDLNHLVELWANLSNLRLLEDYQKWQWSFRAESTWLEYAKKTLEQKNFVLVVCDYQDNGYSGFLHAHLEFLPISETTKNQKILYLHILDFYLRPKDKNLDNILGLLNCSLSILKKREYKLKIKVGTESLDQEIINILTQSGKNFL